MHVRDRPARIAAEAGLAVVFAVLLVFWAVQVAASWGAGYWPFGFAAGTVVSGIALARRRDRVWAAVAGLAVAAVAVVVVRFAQLPSEPGPAMAVALSVLVGSVVRTAQFLPACAVGASGLVLAAGTLVAASPSPSAAVPAVTALSGMTWLAGIVTGLSLRLRDARRRVVVERVRRDQRLELARELHDVVAHHITGSVLQTQAARIARRTQPETLDESLAGIEAANSEALAAVRRVVGLLRDTDDAAPATPGPEQLSELVDRFAGHLDGHGPVVQLQMPDLSDGRPLWPPEVTSTVYRVVQESLTNIARHASHARSITVSVAQDPRSVTLEVVDDAAPAPALPHHRGGYGLVGIRERVEALDGTLTVGPHPGAGWYVRATLPLPALERW